MNDRNLAHPDAQPPDAAPPPSAPNAPRQTQAVARVEQPARQMTKAEVNYQTVTNALKANNGADAKAIRAMLGGDKALMDRFLATTFALLATNSRVLEQASPASLVQAIKDAASLGLEPMTQDGGFAVYSGVATFMPSWQGHLKRIRNSGRVQDVDVQLVYDNDTWDWSYTERGGKFSHTPAKADRGGYWGVYAYAVMPSGFIELEVMTEADVNDVRDKFGQTHSRDGKPLPWATSWGEMARKTALRRLRKRLPQSPVDMLLDRDEPAAVEAVEAVRDELSAVRELALRAAGAIPASTDTPEASVGAPLAEA